MLNSKEIIKIVSKKMEIVMSSEDINIVSNSVEKYILEALDHADKICKENKRKIITNHDLKTVLENINLPFMNILE